MIDGNPPEKEARPRALAQSPPLPDSAKGVNWLNPCVVRSALLGTFAAAVALALGAGFTVDDALISTRIAHHLSSGVGYRFNAGDAVVDAVTPLGWAHLLAPFSANGVWAGLQAARLLGTLSALLCGALLGVLIATRTRAPRALWALLPLAVSLPFGAWGQSGMETPLIALLVCASLFEKRGVWLAASGAAALRPELLPWALTWAALRPAPAPKQRLIRVLQALSLPVVVAGVRFAAFGQLAPLSVFAKPADAGLGFAYVLSGLVFIGLPLASLRLPGQTKLDANFATLGAALWVELLALATAGGDWMALFRLFVPLLPAWVWLFAQRLAVSSPRIALVRITTATALAALLLVSHGASSRAVVAHRQRAITELAALLKDAPVVGTVDVGWVGAATRGTVVDFAGVTDPEVAYLPGSHTSKRLPPDFIRRKRINHLVLLLAPDVTKAQLSNEPWTSLHFARVVERRIALMEEAPQFAVLGHIEFGGSHRYVVLGRESSPRQSVTASERALKKPRRR